MKKLLLGIMVLFLLGLMAACNKDDQGKNDVPELLEVKLSITPEKATANQPVTFEAKVTQGGEAVTDADEVKFEIWRAKDEHHEKIKIEHAENGIYRLEKSFPQDGTYYIISHVTARDMHNMPKKEFIIGEPSEPEDGKSSDSMEGMDMEGHGN
ncbi:FixH family protein [Neobacillus dielmonensis]|uniref:FixH family protein n=1 Tax=Neobacillus dielmonensis TaxID=1347369 RepID=UPI0005A8308F|nr:FixH family protein [Neobacillus dielmonensis]